MKRKIWIGILIAFLGNAPAALAGDSEVVMKHEIVSSGPMVMKTKFYIHNKEIARRTYKSEEIGLRMGETSIEPMLKLVLIDSQGVIPDGIVKDYYPSGALFAEHRYKNNQRNGTSKMYYQGGQLMGVSKLKKDKVLNGKAYDENGNLEMEFFYEKNGQIRKVKQYLPDGGGYSEMLYENGKVKSSKLYRKNGPVEDLQK